MFYRLGWVGVLLGLSCFLFGASEQEPNDDFSQATFIAQGDTIFCAMLDPSRDMDFFKFLGSSGDTLITYTLNCEDSHTDTYLSLFDSLEDVLAYDNNSGDSAFSRIEYELPYNGTYYLRVVKIQSTPDSSYSLIVDLNTLTVASHDCCAYAHVVDGIPYQESSSTVWCGSECGTPSPDVWYFFSNPSQRTLVFSACMTDFHARVHVMGGCCEQFGDDSEDGCGDGAILMIPDIPVGDYYILVEGTDIGEVGNFIFQVNGETQPCPEPEELTLATVDGYPFLFWESVSGASFYVIWQSNSPDAGFEHTGTTFDTYWTDSTGFSGTKRFYRVTTYCPW
ncbi:pre-peptidase C-terminal domain-containing protein [bacterium]|nr:pre-peptidase C-terminal domain-containing protein [bacterium]